MQIVETSDGIVVFGIIDENDQQETWLNHDEVLNIAYKNPNKQVIVSDSPSFLINDENYLSLLSEGQPENITVSDELWSKLKIDNFKVIRKSALRNELGNIIGNGAESIDRAKAALEILSPHGMEDVKINKKDGKEEIFANVDGKECVINISLGRSNDYNEENVLYDDQISTNLRLTITTDNPDDYPDHFTYRGDGLKYIKIYEDKHKLIYTPEKLDRFLKKELNEVLRTSKLPSIIDDDFYSAKYDNCADLTDLPQEILYEYEDYAANLDGTLYFHNSGDTRYDHKPTKELYVVFPSITIDKRN